MSHELSFREDGAAEMVYVHRNAGDVPWHKFGTPISEGLSIEQAIEIAGLGWDVIKTPVMFQDNDGNYLTFPDKFVTYRPDRNIGLGVVGSDYREINNVLAFRSAAQVARIKGASVETMGALKEGRCVWALVQLPGGFDVRGDKHLKYLLVHTTHDGTGKMRVKVVATRVVCKNTVDAAFGEGGRELAFSHTDKFDDEIKRAEGVFEAADEVFEKFKAEAEGMQEQIVTPAKADEAIEVFAKRAMWNGASREDLEIALSALAPTPADLVIEQSQNLLDRILTAQDERVQAVIRENERKTKRYKKAIDLIHSRLDEEREGSDITAWLLANAMTGWVDHERSGSRGERRFSSLMLGQGDKLKNAAFEVVRETVQQAA